MLVNELRPFPNWYLDLANERNIRDKRFASIVELKELRALVRTLDPNRLVTASHGGDMTKEELKEYLQEARLDFISPHRPREPQSPSETGTKTREYLQWMTEVGITAPIHYQEPFRRGYDRWQPQAADYLADARNAKDAGAAGWCFHNGGEKGHADGRPRRSFDLRDSSLFEQLDEQERRALTALKDLFSARP